MQAGGDLTYDWSASVRSLADLDGWDTLEELTSADTPTATRRTTEPARVASREPKPSDRVRGLDGRTAVLLDAVADVRRRGGAGHAVVVLRRLSGCLSAVCDALQHAVVAASERATPDAASRYLECASWWASELVGSFEDAIGRCTAQEREAALVSAAQFAALYAFGHLAPLRDTCSQRAEIEELHREITWLATSLHEELVAD